MEDLQQRERYPRSPRSAELLMVSTVSPEELTNWLVDGDELAVLDAREQGVYFDSHLFHAACIPLSSLELLIERLVPRRDVRMVWCDDGSNGDEDGLAVRAAAKAIEFGYTNVSVLQGGTAGWAATGGELYSGVNVPSKAFGEFVEHAYGTPRMPAAELQQLIEQGADMVILDSRPMNEFSNMSIPTGIDCPGAELVHRVKEVAPDPNTLVVVNCAGRTRSIIGTQSLINAGLENRVIALENGTMGWELAGFECSHGLDQHAPDPGTAAKDWSEKAVAAVAKRFNVNEISPAELAAWQRDASRTTYLLDVRTPEEFSAGHIAGSVSAPGGQLVQATDEYVATQNARLVLVDDNGVRATMTASWLQQLGWSDTVVLADGVEGHPLGTGSGTRVAVPGTATVTVSDLAELLADETKTVAVLDIGSSLKYRKRGHIPGSWWGVRSRLPQAHQAIGEADAVVITSTDGQLAKLAVDEAQELWGRRTQVSALASGNRGWRHAGHDMDTGFDRATTQANDVWYKPYDHEGEVVDQHMRDYLTWEIALVEQLDRDPTVNFQRYD
ncbi:hypothetical protein GQR58_029274 [Nymphon striatum]|nr:hypothetical protein GQR58_029274 [Nymphon striatum]